MGNGDFTFEPAVIYADQSRPTALTVGDFNRDGRLDLASANTNNGTTTSGLVSILFGNANGTFQPAVSYATIGANPRAIAAGDLNADGILDLAVENTSGDTAILIGNPNGTFQPALNYYTRNDGLVAGPIALAIGDLNGDGLVDVSAGGTLLLGNGKGTYPGRRLFTYIPAAINADIGNNSEPQEIAAGDFNGDGNIDLAVAILGTAEILFGNGNGSFLPPVPLTPPGAAGISTHAARIAVADMDGDGDLDVVTVHFNSQPASGAVAIWRNNGSGIFSTPLVRVVPMPKYDYQTVDMELGDLNGDGFIDVVVTDNGNDGYAPGTSGGVSVMLGVGDGSLAAPIRYAMPFSQTAFRPTLGDVNRDGRPDIVVLTNPGTLIRTAVGVFINAGDGSFGPAGIYDYGGGGERFLATGDFNNDGAADIIVPDGNSNTFNIIYAGEEPVLVTDAPVTVTATNLNPVSGIGFTAQVATFVDANPFSMAGDFTATINWGDSQTSIGTVRVNPLGGFEVIGTHNYAASGVFTTVVTVVETGEGTHPGSATIRVSATDQQLTATGVTFSAEEDRLFTGTVATFTDADSNGSSGDFSAVINWGDGQTSAGAIAPRAGGGFAVIGTHTYANPGTLPVIVSIADIGGSRATANSSAQVTPHVNQAPVAATDIYSTHEDTTLVIPVGQGVLANDTDPDLDPLTAVIVTGPAHGSLTLNPNGSFSYLPAASFNGLDSFTYKANDGAANSSVTTVTINVTAVNDGPVANIDAATTNEDTSVIINVLANDANRDGIINPTTVAFTGLPLHGTVRINPITGAITYIPSANFFGSDSLRYRVRDNNSVLSNEAVVSITVTSTNDAALAIRDHYIINEDTPLNVLVALGVLANDSDLDGNPFTATLIDAPQHGAVMLNSNGSFIYAPAANYSGSDSFRYQASDGTIMSAPATVTLIVLAVNDAPAVATITDQVINEGSLFTASSAFNDPDLGDVWTATVDYGDGSGAQPLELTGSNFELNHAYLDNGIYFANVKVTDQNGTVGQANFKVTVQNLVPTVQAGADRHTIEGTLISVLASFSDLGLLDTHTATINWGDGSPTQSMPVNELSGTGTSSASHAYADENTYVVTVTVTDDDGGSTSDTLTVTVNNAKPRVAAGVDRSIDAGDLLTLTNLFTTEVFNASVGTFSYQSVAGSYVDAGALDTHIASIDWGDGTTESLPVDERPFATSVTGALRGTHVYTNGGTFTVVITVTDNDGGVGTDSFLVTVNSTAPNLPPAAINDIANANKNTSATINILANDSDADGNIDPTSVVIVAQPTHGTTSINPATGVVTYTAASDYVGPDSFTYRVKDNQGSDSNVATVSITVHDVAEPPDLDLGGPAVTWIKKRPAVTVMPQLIVTGGSSLAGGQLTIHVNEIRSKNGKKLMDRFQIPSLSSLGTTSGPQSANGQLTLIVQLNETATAPQIQAALRQIKFLLTKGKGLKTLTRSLEVTLTDSNGLSDHVTQTIHVLKKRPGRLH